MYFVCLTPSFRGFRHGFASPPRGLAFAHGAGRLGFATLNVADEPLVQVLAAEAIRKAAMAAVEREGWKRVILLTMLLTMGVPSMVNKRSC